MRNSGYKSRVIDWSRLAVKLALILTDPKTRADIQDGVQSRVEHASDTITKKYEQAADRLDASGAALQGKGYWPSRVVGFLLGVGVGASLGLLLAPATGTETRETIRDKAVDMKDRVANYATKISGPARRSVSSMPSTGTQG